MNVRKTLQKQKIFDNLSKRYDHPTSKDIYDDLKDEGIGLATIYRNLNSLLEEGKVVKIIDNDQISHFDAVKDEHCHFVCRSCGMIEDIPVDKLFKKDIDMEVDYNNVVLNGICKKCLEKLEKGKD